MALDIKTLLDSGLSPREVHERANATHRDKIQKQIDDGGWKCPKCKAPMQLMPEANILVCGNDCRYE